MMEKYRPGTVMKKRLPFLATVFFITWCLSSIPEHGGKFHNIQSLNSWQSHSRHTLYHSFCVPMEVTNRECSNRF